MRFQGSLMWAREQKKNSYVFFITPAGWFPPPLSSPRRLDGQVDVWNERVCCMGNWVFPSGRQ